MSKSKTGNTAAVDVVKPSVFVHTARESCERLWEGIFPEGQETDTFLDIVSSLEQALQGSRTKVLGHEYHGGDNPEAKLLFSRLTFKDQPRNTFLASIGSTSLMTMHVVEEGQQVGVLDAHRQTEGVAVNVQDPFFSMLHHPPRSERENILYAFAPTSPSGIILQAVTDIHYIHRDLNRAMPGLHEQ
ncbi:hypothetical protein KDA00_02360 [Candidatus Saccharibacteria bacterium]|nr:hypothetical protein [Candidatus Saccharibacteria bacterium]